MEGRGRCTPAPSHLLIRGDVHSRGPAMQPGFLTVATNGNPATELPPLDGLSTGGAVVGHRVRMQRHHAIPVLSYGPWPRGQLGGLAAASGGVALLLDAAGFGTILIETMGVGPGRDRHTPPRRCHFRSACAGHGDDVQAMKAGILEMPKSCGE